MKIGLISDIHGDIVALMKALAILNKQDVEHILCAGDLVQQGPDKDGVIELIQERGIPCVQGNHDEWEIDTYNWTYKHGDLKNPVVTRWLLKEESATFLKQLPLEKRFEFAGKKLLLAHGVPWDNMIPVFPRTDDKIFSNLIRTSAADIVILGHTHRPMQIIFPNMMILNSGSVCGRHYPGSSTCAILTLPQMDYAVYGLENREVVEFPRVEKALS